MRHQNGCGSTELDGKIDLLLSDVIMPGCNGRELYTELSASCPALKVIFMSGYSNRGIVRDGLLDDGTPILEKPFNVKTLARAIRKALEQ